MQNLISEVIAALLVGAIIVSLSAGYVYAWRVEGGTEIIILTLIGAASVIIRHSFQN